MALTSLSVCEREGKVRNECMAGLTLPLCGQINQSLVFRKKKKKNCRSTAPKNKECTQLFIIVPVDLLQNKV